MSVGLVSGLAVVAVVLALPLAWLLGAAFAVIQQRFSGGSLVGACMVLLLCAADGVTLVWLGSYPAQGNVPDIHISDFWTVVLTCVWIAGVLTIFSEGKGIKLGASAPAPDNNATKTPAPR